MMKRETKRRIAYYQDALPDMKKRVFAAALMLMIAVIVSITATYAWVTLSVAPVVSSVNTTMSANGTLEIALSNPEGTEPEELDIDESVSASSDVKVTNLQWGNLINLSDSSYGIDNLVLRPAQLNTASLKNSPLWGAVYGSDGRITTLDSNYTFMKWKELAGQGTGDFMYSQENGVRAIASYTVTVSEGTSVEYTIMSDAVVRAQNAVENAYADVAPKMADLSTMISSFAQGVVNEKLGSGSVDPFSSKDIQDVYNLYVAMLNAMELEKDAMVALANFQSFIAAQDPSLNHTHVTLTWDDLVANKANYNAASTATTSKNGIISITGLTQFITDLNTITTDTSYLERYYQNATTDVNNTDTTKCVYYWDTTTGLDSGYQISDIVQRLISWTTMTMVIDGVETRLTSLSMDTAISLATSLNNKHTNVYVCGGVMKNFEQIAIDRNRLQGQTNESVVTVTVKAMGMPINVYGDCYTKAADSSYFMTDYMAALGEKLLGSDVVGEDTYGMAVDFWLRTNAEETYLTLEGAIAAEEDGTVYSYDGINRVWGATGDELLTTNSTTQGGGSCYIYYADTPEDMMRSLQLLKSMKVAFVDPNGNNGNGALLAQASMDTENYYAVNGRITVPLAVEATSGVSYTYTDTDGTTEMTGRAVTLLTHDVPVMITAIIYLDGAYLTNDDVLAANHIDGQLNIQFGSSVDLETLGDNKLLVAERVVTAAITQNGEPVDTIDYMTAADAAEKTVDVTVTIDGTDADNVEAFFIRAINSTQGVRQDTMTFAKSSTEGVWTASYEFLSPGTYYLRYVRLDGVDYALENPPKVEVTGISVSTLEWDQGGDLLNIETPVTVYSPDSAYPVNVTATIASTSTAVNLSSMKVQARFLRDDGIMVNADLRYDPTSASFEGTGTFYRSGTYELQYLLVDGEYYDVSGRLPVLKLYLGLSVAVYNNGSIMEETYDANAAEGTYSKDVGVRITDNDGNDLPVYEYDEDGNATMADWAQSVILRYSQGGSATSTVDATLTWNDTHSWFEGTLPITKPGRYVFQSLRIGATGSESTLSRVTEYPTYVIISPDPPEYVTSESTYSEEAGEVQFAQLSNDAFIGPIVINNSAGASMSAVVSNDVTGEEYTITMGTGMGQMYHSESGWIINLPVYTDTSGAETQEGVWSVEQISAWDCYDADTNYRDEENPIVWTDSDVDFDKLTTDVSCSINVKMEPGTTALGSSTAAFMAKNYVGNIGMSITLTDDDGRTIPATVLPNVKLTVSYAGNTDKSYGYEVDASANGGSNTYPIYFTLSGDSWVVNTTNSNYLWQYVGKYTVTGLDVWVDSEKKLEIRPDENGSFDSETGIPSMYTVTSSAPTAGDLTIGTLSQGKTVFGADNDGSNVTGTFLQSYGGTNLGKVNAVLMYDDGTDTPKAATAAKVNITANLILDYVEDGTLTSDDCGGYTWTTDSNTTNALENISVAMTRNSLGDCVAGTTPLLAGQYKVSAEVSVDGGTPKVVSGKTITVYSMKPTVTMTAVSPTTEVTVNRDAGVKVSTNTFTAYNAIVNNGKSALVFVSYRACGEEEVEGSYTGDIIGTYTSYANSSQLAHYDLPTITFELSGGGTTCTNFVLPIPGNAEDNYAEFFGNGSSGKVEIGKIDETGKAYFTEAAGIWGDKSFGYLTQKPVVIGTQDEINTINATHNGVTYTLTLSDTLSIVQENEAPPSISFEAGVHLTPTNEKLEWTAPEGATSDNGLSFTFKLPTVEEYTTKTANVFVETNPTEWTVKSDWTAGTDYYAIYSNYVTGEPYQVKDDSYTIIRKYYRYTYGCKNTYYYDVYLTHSRTWERTASVDTYLAVFGLTGWEVNGVRYEPGATITVNGANIKAIPILGELSRPSAPSSSAPRTQTGTTYIEKKLDAQTTVIGAQVTAQGSANRNQTTAISNATSAATSAAQNAAATQVSNITISGYTIVGGTTALPNYTESAIVEGAWK